MDQQTVGRNKASTISVIRSWSDDSSIHLNMLAAFLMGYRPTLSRHEVAGAVDAVLEVMWSKRGNERLRVLLMMLDVFMHENVIRCFGHVLSAQNTYIEQTIETLPIKERVLAALYVLEEGAQRIVDGKTQIDDCIIDGEQYVKLAGAFLPGQALKRPDARYTAAYHIVAHCVRDYSDIASSVSLGDISKTVQLVFDLEPPNPAFLREWKGELDVPEYLKNRLLNQGLWTWQLLLSKTEKELRRGNPTYEQARDREGLGNRGIEHLSAALAKRGYRIGQFAKR